MAEPASVPDFWLLGGLPRRQPRVALTAGPLTAEFEPETGALRYVRCGDVEILRGVYAAVRDADWGTVAPALSDLRCTAAVDRFDVSFVAECRDGEIAFRWRGSIAGAADGTIRYRLAGEALQAFRTNRIGFCVLHAAEAVAGRTGRVETVDGATHDALFPELIAPHQPLRNVRAIAHEAAPGLHVEVRMSGDTFEMEDQRNWTDATFKTYSRPLALPYPYAVEPGERIEQEVELRVRPAAPPSRRLNKAGPTLTFSRTVALTPTIGVGWSSSQAPLGARNLARLRLLRPTHLRVDLHLAQPDARGRLENAGRDADAVAAALELALHVTDAADEELRALAAALTNVPARVARVLVFHVAEKSTSAHWGRLARERLRPLLPDALIGLGTDGFFAELNRDPPTAGAADFISYSVNPQVHADDEASIVESLAGQAATVASARALGAGAKIVVSPVTLRMRFNPNATIVASPDRQRESPPVDPRQRSLFAAAWTLGSLQALAAAGASSVTYYEAVGPAGLMESDAGAFPLFHVLADVGEWSMADCVPLESSHPLVSQGFALQKAGRLRMMLANLDASFQIVRCQGGPAGRRFQGRLLDATSAAYAAAAPEDFRRSYRLELASSHQGEIEVELPPYAVLTLDEA